MARITLTDAIRVMLEHPCDRTPSRPPPRPAPAIEALAALRQAQEALTDVGHAYSTGGRIGFVLARRTRRAATACTKAITALGAAEETT